MGMVSPSTKNVIIPDTIEGLPVEKIVVSAFRETYIESIHIPDSVKEIGDNAFYECINLITVTFGETPQLQRIGKYAFHYCRSLTAIELPFTLTTIDKLAFNLCSNLTEIVIPINVIYIGMNAFGNRDNLYNLL